MGRVQKLLRRLKKRTWPPFDFGFLTMNRKKCKSLNRSSYFLVIVLLMVWPEVLVTNGEVLTPPYFNLAQGRRISATSTCGEGADGYAEREMYCKLVGATTDTDDANNVIHGQYCDYCEKGVEGHYHPAEHAIDGSERWWQSPPLSRGVKYNDVNLTIDLGQEFHVAYVTVRMANSPRPGVWVLERSRDNGKTYKPWQYFAENPHECERFFGKESTFPITADDSVVCDTENSKVVPLEGGEIIIRLLEGRPSAPSKLHNKFFESEVLQEWTRATNVRLRFIRTKTLLGHLMSLSRQDLTVTRRYFYSVKDIQIGGRCRCNGHADICPPARDDPYKLLCSCQHNTCGPQCESCCPGYVQKAWRVSTNDTPFSCEGCNCHGHSNECEYDEEVDKEKLSLDLSGNYDGGGVCKNCRDNTEGINCHKCSSGYFRAYGKSLDSPDVCEPCNCNYHYSTGNCMEGSGRCECSPAFQSPNCDSCSVGYYDFPGCRPCDCNFNGTRGQVCEVGGGQCPCKQNYQGANCDRCADGYYNFPDCLACECEDLGSVSPVCDPESGQCECGNNYGGRQCSECENGYYSFPTCNYCNCDVQGTREGICHKSSGECLCREGYGGARCDQCLQGFYGYPNCLPCNCSTVGSASTICDATGKCPCLPNFSDRACTQCTPGYYQFPECLPCGCDEDGSLGVSCDDEGKCQCKMNFEGLRCEMCQQGFYNHPLCEGCNCDPAGVTETFRGCSDMPQGELCQCKEHVDGRICNSCKPLFWNLQQWNPTGCEDCDCFGPGIIGGVRVCEGATGQCPCKNYVDKNSRRCEECLDGYFNLTAVDVFGCRDCGCDVGGAVNNICDKQSGQCTCRPRISGIQCEKPLQAHYFPTLYQFQNEAEDGTTPSGGQVRFGYTEEDFPNYSWRGYAVYSALQPETNHVVNIEKSSLYRVVIRYLNPGEGPVIGEIKATPDNPQDDPQTSKVRFEPRDGFLTVSTGVAPSPFVLNPGRWQFSIKSDKYLLIDYFTLLPAAYYEGTILMNNVKEPCMLNTTNRGRKDSLVIPDSCVKFKYPSTDRFDSVSGLQGYGMQDGEKFDLARFYSEKKVLEALEVQEEKMALLSPQQSEVHLDMQVSKGGRYAMIIEYFTPQGANLTELDVESTSKKGVSQGKALIHNCKLATLCRQVVTTPNGEVAIFRVDHSSFNMVLRAPEEITDRIAVNSVIAVPIGKWSLDHITPREYCVVNNGSCIQGSFELPPDYIKVEAESGVPERIADDNNMPPGVTGKNLVALDPSNRSVDMNGKVQTPGYYTFLVHYYQPENPFFTAEIVLKNGQHYAAKVPLVHCPSTSGCRAMVAQDDKNTKFYIQDNFMVTIKSPKNVWIDYVLAVPGEQEAPPLEKYLSESPLDETRKFIAECGKSHFYLGSNSTDFCRDAVFSLTTDYNNGALPCQCDYYGSTDFSCNEFGGQCPCKENVIGRRCEKCKTGFFGFPDCKPCSCPSTALCDELTGACICPPRVTGEKCDTCSPFTYGFDALIGCEDCNCSPLGVEGNNLQCDLFNGTCRCKPNIVGRSCSQCKPGFWAFPYCQMCDCDIRGTTSDICNQDVSTCYCKSNVEGRACDQCKPGSFNLQETNPTGCTSCFCFGKTTRCTQSYLFWTQISFGKNHWTAVTFDPTSNAREREFAEHEIEFEDVSGEDESAFIPLYIPEDTVPLGGEQNVLYFRSDIESNHLASFGGRVTYKLVSEPADNIDRQTFAGPDVVLEGRELSPSSGVIRLMHYAVDHLDGEHAMRMDLILSEENFVVQSGHSGGLVQATRDQMMIVLKGLKAIYVRAGYWRQTREVKLSSFGIEVATEDYAYRTPEDRAVTVEQCQCPPNYQGLSCEECAPGYYRSPSGPFGGFCVPCQCNGHADTCDPVSGLCSDCRHNTTGDHCEMCEEGFHGNARGGTPYDCLICACPVPIAMNNFATQCEMSPTGDEISCVCKDGYIGNRCEGCDSGFYGRPESLGDYCKPCECSGNIDVSDPYSCDSVTGACLRCMNNTGGPACNICERGFYGDALLTKDCRQCSCSKCGTFECEHSTGECNCLENVEGYLCDRCRPDHYGLSRCDGTGCQYCDCGIASENTQCDDLTGQCECKKGTTGRRCERCAPGFYNYTEDGCQPCECNQDYSIGVGCDPETGQCSCLPGVVGASCDRCPWRWVLIEDRGCQGCDSCQHQLLDVTDEIAAMLDPVKDEFDNVAVTYFTTQRLAYFNDTVSLLKPNVQLMDPSKADLSQFYTGAKDLDTDAATQRQKAETIGDSLKEKAKLSAKLKDKSFEVESKVQEAVAKATTTVFETKDLMEGLLAEDKPSSSPQTDAAKAEAEAILASMNSAKFDQSAAIEENATVTTVLKDMRKFVRPLTKLDADLEKARESIDETRDKLRDLRNQSDHSITTSRQSNDIAKKIKDAKFPAKLAVLEGKANDMLDNIGLATDLNSKSPVLLDNLELSFIDLDASVDSVREQKIPLGQSLDTLKNELDNNKNTIEVSQEHARNLEYEADNLDAMLERTRSTSENAVGAATANKKIKESLNDALAAADKAKDAAENATGIINGLDERANEVVEPSRNLLVIAGDSLRQVEQELKIPVSDAKLNIENVESINNITITGLSNFDKELEKLKAPRDMSDVKGSIRTSKKAAEKAQDAQADVDDILENLPKHSNKLRQLRVTVSDLNSGVGISDSQLKQAKEAIPLSSAITGNLESKKPEFEDKKSDIATKLADLKAQIASAREQANRIPVGMNLQDSSSLLLANPQSLESQQAQTKVSFHFRTQDDGLIFYLGNEPGRKEEDFMAVEVDRGYPVLTVDLGSGPQRIMNEKFVADGSWYKATVDRAGKTVRFTIAAEDQFGNVEETTKEDYLQGSKSLFNVDRNSSKLYVGGLPPGQSRSPVRYSTFRGAIEDLTIGDEKVGLWNFREAQNVAAAHERDRFVNLEVETGLRFQGNGYAILDRKPFQLKERSAIAIRFKTRSKNGLIFLVGKGRKFMSIEINNGAIFFQYDLGGGLAQIKTDDTYNDGQWHILETVRYRQHSHLNVDGKRIVGQSPGPQVFLLVGDYMYFGGYPGDHGYPTVTRKAFEGCLESVSIEQAPVDLTQAVDSVYTAVGCPSSQFAPTVATFFGDGYLQIDSAQTPVSGPVVVTKDDSFEVNFRFRPNETDGLMFYGSDADQSNYLSVSMQDGALFIKTEPGGAQIRTDAIDDTEWHVLTVTRDRDRLVVNIDDAHEYSESAPSGPLELTTQGSTLLFGGKPADFPVRSGASMSERPYSGCLADISINGNRVDFSESSIKDSNIGEKCVTKQEKDAMAQEVGQRDLNGWRIPVEEEEAEDVDAEGESGERPVTPRRTTTTQAPKDFGLPDFDETETGKEDEKDDTEEEEMEKKPPKEDEVTPTPFMKCALPYRDVPSDTDDISMDDGVMFGNVEKTSRLEYLQPRDDGSRSEYSIDFRTSQPNGLIFMWTEFDKMDYVALFMRRGYLHFAFDSGSGPAVLNSTVMFNDTKWHTASFNRYQMQGELSVDGTPVATGSSSGSTTNVNAGSTIYIGGLPTDAWSKRFTMKKTLNIDSPFRGCLKNFQMRGKTPTEIHARHSVQPCTDSTEKGFFFYPNSGYLKIAERFKVGRNIKLSLSIRPRHPSGILLAVHGDKDFLVLQLVNGTIKFTVDSGKGPISSSYRKDTYDLCDGNWHTIRVTKSKNVLTLALDNQYSSPGIGQAGKDATNTNDPLYIGGHPNPGGLRGIETTDQYVGCLKDFIIEGRQYKMNHDAIVGKVGIHSCPTD